MKYDIIIIGAGPAGLSFARALAETRLNILIVEKQSMQQLSDPDYDGREIALTHLSHKIMNELGIWQLIEDADISLIKHAKVLNGDSPYTLNFDHTEAGAENLGFMISNHIIRKAAIESVQNYSNIQILTEQEVLQLGTDDKKAWVELADGERMEAKLVIAADSRFSTTRRMMGISTSMLDFGRSCIVCTMQHELPHHDTAYECFHYDRTVAVLPLNDQQVSVVITLNSAETESVLSMDKAVFAADIQKRIDNKFGKMSLSSKLYPYPLVATLAKKFNGKRFAVIGDAAVGMHPVTAHGFNLGLRGADTLAKEIIMAIETKKDFASQEVLARYSRRHRHVAAPLFHGTNAIVTLYTRNHRRAKFARDTLLKIGNKFKPLKRVIMNKLTEI